MFSAQYAAMRDLSPREVEFLQQLIMSKKDLPSLEWVPKPNTMASPRVAHAAAPGTGRPQAPSRIAGPQNSLQFSLTAPRSPAKSHRSIPLPVPSTPASPWPPFKVVARRRPADSENAPARRRQPAAENAPEWPPFTPEHYAALLESTRRLAEQVASAALDSHIEGYFEPEADAVHVNGGHRRAPTPTPIGHGRRSSGSTGKTTPTTRSGLSFDARYAYNGTTPTSLPASHKFAPLDIEKPTAAKTPVPVTVANAVCTFNKLYEEDRRAGKTWCEMYGNECCGYC
ncbi:hypothetical protein EXIGLDRAFT_773095 [Exidia glandulosa HHB12029]|uniref:Uncharacterized protein n=1 Tax=Exidia glandulosa HHB12029 TaxID=1314781 RepID=A0A165EZC4_EXIGL|nr:hypothetical protein EXIGLDRAFT_773095 [Exidia glandulosa HHB12029]